jgi:hypothetical protein
MRGTSHLQLVAIAALMMFVRASAAAPVSHQVRWLREGGATSCIDERDLVAGVEQRLGRALGGDVIAVRVIQGRVEAIDGGYRAHIVVFDERGVVLGERELVEPSADCRKLDDKLTLVIALAIDPDAVARQSAAQPPPPPPLPPPPPITSPHVAPPRAPWNLALGVSGAAALGVMPGLGVGGRLSLAIDPPSVPALVIGASAWAPDRETVADGGSRFTLVGAGAAICPRLRTGGMLGIAVCGGVEVERMTARGFDFDANQRAVDWIVHVTGEAVAAIGLGGRWSAEVGLGGWVPLIRPRFVYTDGPVMPTVYQPPVTAAVLRLGVVRSL